MIYNVTYSCGHTGEADINGITEKEREKKVLLWSSHLCPKCSLDKRELIDLTPEASLIREKKLLQVERWVIEHEIWCKTTSLAKIETPESREQSINRMRLFVDYLSRKSADWWLKHEHTHIVVMYKTRELPDLSGTAKQVNWAEKLRADRRSEISELIRVDEEKFKRLSVDEQKKYQSKHDDGIKKMNDFKNWLFSHSDAGWWLDNRNLLTKQLAKKWTKEKSNAN